jgi:hypothetical protein
MTAAPEWDLLLYVKEVRVILRVLGPADRDQAFASLSTTGMWPLNRTMITPGRMDGGNFDGKPVIHDEIPEDEAEAIHCAWDAAHKRNFRLHIVDVSKESSLRRVIEEHLHHLKAFPVLVRKDGQRLEGCTEFTPEKLDKFLGAY